MKSVIRGSLIVGGKPPQNIQKTPLIYLTESGKEPKKLHEVQGGFLSVCDGSLYYTNKNTISKMEPIAVSSNGSVVISDNSGVSAPKSKNTVAIGRSTGGENDVDSSVLIGNYAGSNMESGGTHVVIGVGSAQNLQTGESNTITGYNTYRALKAGSNNIGIGNDIGKDISECYDNIAIGSNALKNSHSMGGNISIGSGSMGECGQGQSNVAIGRDSLSKIQDNWNIAIGDSSGKRLNGFNTERNIIIGIESCGNATVNVSGNIAMGHRVLFNPSCFAFNNVMIGNDVASEPVSDIALSGNVMIGENVGKTSKGVVDSVIIGSDAGVSVSGSKTIIIGNSAASHTQGKCGGEVIIGQGAGSYRSYSDITNKESMSILIGWMAGSGNASLTTSGDYLIAIGVNAGANVPNSESSVMIGKDAGSGSKYSSKSVMIGENSGVCSEGAGNVFIGDSTGRNTTGGGNVIVGNAGSSSKSQVMERNIIIGSERLCGRGSIVLSTGDILDDDEEHEGTFLVGYKKPFLYGDLTSGNIALGSNTIVEDLWGENVNSLYLQNNPVDKYPPTGEGGLVFSQNGTLRYWPAGKSKSTMISNGESDYIQKKFNVLSGSTTPILTVVNKKSTESWLNIKFEIFTMKAYVKNNVHLYINDEGGMNIIYQKNSSDEVNTGMVSGTDLVFKVDTKGNTLNVVMTAALAGSHVIGCKYEIHGTASYSVNAM